MKTSNHTVLITGGSSGIGLSLAKKYLLEKNTVIITGRSEEKLRKVKEQFPEIITEVADMASEADRHRLVDQYRDVNILVNNAGVQFNYQHREEKEAHRLIEEELNINLIGPIQFTTDIAPEAGRGCCQCDFRAGTGPEGKCSRLLRQ